MAAFDRLHTTFYWSAIVNVALSCSPNLETGWCQHMKVTMSVSKTPQIQSSFQTEQRSIHQSISVVQFKINNNIKLFHESMMDLFDHWRVAQVIISELFVRWHNGRHMHITLQQYNSAVCCANAMLLYLCSQHDRLTLWPHRRLRNRRLYCQDGVHFKTPPVRSGSSEASEVRSCHRSRSFSEFRDKQLALFRATTSCWRKRITCGFVVLFSHIFSCVGM